MNILILGSGGREHALAWKLSSSKRVRQVFAAPGNAGTASFCTNLGIDPMSFEDVKAAVLNNKVDMVVVGPEAPLVEGIHDFFLADSRLRNVPVIGPDKKAAQLEGSKDFAKAFLTRHGIPTAKYMSFDKSGISGVEGFLKTLDPPYVIKADGLAAGKGVIIVNDLREALQEVESMLSGKFGSAGKKVVIEEFLSGIELSVFIITDGKSYKLLPEAKDYKRVGEGDTGLNTGGMGAISPVPFAGEAFMKKTKESIIEPTLDGLRKDGITYKGFIFFGLINVNGEPFVIEYNARLGDPESEVIIPRIKSDLVDLLEGVAEGNLDLRQVEFESGTAVTVMLVSGGYPGDYVKGKRIEGIENVQGSTVFHAGTRLSGSDVLTSGGRVLAVTSLAGSMQEALEKSYMNAARISFEGMYFRKDIGFDLHD